MGTLVPMIDMVSDSFSISTISGTKFFGGLFMVLGVVSTLLFFQQSKISDPSIKSEGSKFFTILNYFGKFFIGVTLGSIFAGVIISTSIALIERLSFIFSFIYNIVIR
jgi:Na+/proline symporter